jgi:hypothetical protein
MRSVLARLRHEGREGVGAWNSIVSPRRLTAGMKVFRQVMDSVMELDLDSETELDLALEWWDLWGVATLGSV